MPFTGAATSGPTRGPLPSASATPSPYFHSAPHPHMDLWLAFPTWVDPSYVALCHACWQGPPAARPSAQAVLDRLREVAARVLGPPAAALFPSVRFALHLG